MRKIIPYICAGFFMMSCTSENTLCDCVAAGAKADSISASFFENTPSKEDKVRLDEAIMERDKICYPYQHMLSHELQEKAKDCKNLEFSAE